MTRDERRAILFAPFIITTIGGGCAWGGSSTSHSGYLKASGQRNLPHRSADNQIDSRALYVYSGKQRRRDNE